MSLVTAATAIRRVFPQEDSKASVLTRTGLVMAILIGGALAYWLWFGLTQRSINGPDALSMTAVMGILEEGLQRFPSGYLYTRGYSSHYLTAGSIQAFGFNSFAIVLPSLLMALGTLWLTYLIARDILGRPWLGVVAAAALVLLQVQTFYATGPRMYMALEFFTILAAYSAWRGYICGHARFKLLAFLAIGVAILAHAEGVVIIAAVPAGILAAGLMTRRGVGAAVSPWTVVGILVVAAVVYSQFFYSSPENMVSIAYDDGRAPERVGLHLDPVAYAKHFLNLEQAFPYALTLVPVALFGIFKLMRGRLFGAASRPVYLLLVLAISCVLASMGSREIFGSRIWLFILPVYTLLVCMGGAELWKSLKPASQSTIRVGIKPAILLLFVGLSLSLGMGIMARGADFPEVVAEAYGMPCQQEDCHKVVSTTYENVRGALDTGDVIASSRPPTTYYYLDRIDVVLRDKTDKYEQFGYEEHFGVPVVDRVSELEALEKDNQVWVIADSNIGTVLNKTVREYIHREYTKVETNGFMDVYVSVTE